MSVLHTLLHRAIAQSGGWIGFDRYMAMALYAPGMGYYTGRLPKLGMTPQGGSDFVTAPELSPWFGRTLARSVEEALTVTHTDEVWEFGAGTGALAHQVLSTLGSRVRRYTMVDLSGDLQTRQRATLQPFADQVHWVAELPDRFAGVVIGNEVLDAMPVQLLCRRQGVWHERGVVSTGAGGFAWEDRPTALRPPVEIEGAHDYLTEIHPQAEAFVRTLAERLTAGAAFLIDYGFPEREYYHPQRHMGTVMCHRLHQADPDPLIDVGEKDVTAHVNFTGIALAAQDAGMPVLGYTSQAHFLINSGLLEPLSTAPLPERALAQKLITEHEMGELFKVIALGVGEPWEPQGFVQGDRSHTL